MIRQSRSWSWRLSHNYRRRFAIGTCESSTSSKHSASANSDNAPPFTRPRTIISKAGRAIDARSLAAPSAGAQPVNVLRAGGLQKLQLLRTRKSRPTGMAVRATTRSSTGKRRQARRAKKPLEEEEGEGSRAEEIEEFYREEAQKRKPKPVRYDPSGYNVSTLRETWPSLPVGTTARAGSVLEKMRLMSFRYPSGYEPPNELAKRLFQGKRVLFMNEQEKAQALEEVKNLEQQRAEKLTQRKGRFVEPNDVNFQPTNTEEQNVLIKDLVQGKYPTLEPPRASESPIVREVWRNLDNNGTFRAAGKHSQFMRKLESLLIPTQRVNRV